MTAEDGNKKTGLVIAAIGLVIAVMSIIATVAIFFKVAAWFEESDKYVHKTYECNYLYELGNNNTCPHILDSIPVGSVVGITFNERSHRGRYIGEHCKLETVILGEQDSRLFNDVSVYTVICETVKKREFVSIN